MNKLAPIVVFLVVLILSQTICLLVCVSKVSSTVQRYRVEAETFNYAVNYAVSNYLDRLVSTYNSDSSKQNRDNPSSSPKVVTCNLSTWSSPSGKGCAMDGVRFRVGDYCEYGLILEIASGAVYCFDDGIYTIVRHSPPAPSVAVRTRQRTPATEALEDGAL